ncbi:Hypothetical predicted protein [Octopus vulgaris]|uniref:Uncharacterized protein n=1 Tax=Octopus vulgaris TaxID=6645 RepID=A0AA36B245_OCTVU|nr:Hypothetical predicted protein [Octopus vulgaris]
MRKEKKILNAHMMMWTIVLGPQKRTANNFQARNNDIPTLYGLRKNHKITTDPVAGPPTKPVCEANIASNHRISYFLSVIIRPIIRMSPDVCDSTEDLLSRINNCNNTCDRMYSGLLGRGIPIPIFRRGFCGEVRGDDQRERSGVPQCQYQETGLPT